MPKGKKPKSEPEAKSEKPKKSKELKADQIVKEGRAIIINPNGKDKFVVKIESPERPFRVRQRDGTKGSCVVIANGKEYDVPQSPKMMDLTAQGIARIKE